ncbi:unnamed protein product [Phytophthora fragariaefolia]|nr:unnamed protein product [Phytophthora fragariaefolia]
MYVDTFVAFSPVKEEFITQKYVGVGNAAIQRGNDNYRSLHISTAGLGWGRLCAVDEGEDVRIDEDMELLELSMEPLDPPSEMPTTVADVEATKNMRFDPGYKCVEPVDLYQHSDGTTKAWLRPEFKHIFEHSASASFFAYIPISFWQQVVGETNSYARLKKIKVAKPFSLNEPMTFIGILFYIAVIDKDEYF